MYYIVPKYVCERKKACGNARKPLSVVALSVANTNNYAKIIKYRQQAESNPNKAKKEIPKPDVFTDEFGETAKRKITQPQKRLSEKEIKSVIEEYQSGMSTYALARQYACDRHTISQCLKERGIKVTVEKITSEHDIKEIISLYQGGLKTEEVAERFGISDTTIVKHLHNNGVKMRTRWDY